ncbi:LIM and calponin homology domains-containing protein 1 isoform X26 [Penaeus vannamei]|uniref:LIM and calponin homology domains-containing protein 1 isoform X26 n=1 Tax=Penaeus vannamei TaxID=6689 RepID=UPI00387F78F8
MPGNVRNTGQNDSHRTPITSAARTKSLDCLADKSDKTSEYVPSRITRTQPKIKADAMQFVKPPSNFAHNRWQRSQTGPAGLYKSATEQIKKAEAVKAMRKHLIAEEEDWQQQPSSSSSQSKSPYDEDTDWQTNLDKWKSSRRKRNEDALERVIEIKKNEQEEELNRTRRKSKTFSEMQEEKNKRGRRYNLVVHDDDNNDLADLGLSTVKSSGSLYDGQEDNDVKDLDQDNKDAKSDAGFCTGSDTGSDGVFAEDNISDTSSALVNAQVFEIASKLEETPLLGSPTLRDPSVPLPEPPVQEQDSFEGAKPYTDEDINEVISDYEQVGSVYEEASEHVENIYENITEEPVYENIYEKVGDEIQGEIEEPVNEPHYQTLEEVREEVSANVEPAPAPPSPPQQVASKPPPVIEPPEVLDVTWTDGPSQAAPPCVPPPPPPPDDDSDDDASDQPQGLPEQAEDEPFTRENSTRRIKKELWRRRSDFLGTSSQYIEEEPTVKPPPDLSELLRQEREAERIMAESQRARTPIQETLSKAEIARREKEIIESLERSEQLKQQQQQQQLQYTWQDHMAEETTMTEEQKQLSEHLEYQVAQTESTSSESDIDIQVATNVPVTSANIPTTSQSVMDSKELETMETSSQSPDETFEALPISSKDTVDSVETKAEMLETHVIEPNTTVAKVLPTQTQMEVEAENNVQPESSQQYTDLLESHYSTLDYSSDSVASTGSHPDPYKKLAELEEEMMRHDQDMLQRAGKLAPASTISNDAQPAHIPPPTMYASQEGAPVPSPQAPQTAENNNYSNYQPPAPQLPIQEFYTAPTYEPTPPSSLAPAEGVASPGQKAVSPPTGSPSQYSTLASPHPFTRSHSQSSIGAPPIHPPLQGIRSSPTGSPRDPAPEPLPRKKKLPPPPPSKPHQISGDSTERSEAIRLSRMPTSNPNSVSPQPQEIQGEAVSPSGQQMSKQTLLALSAIPKPRLTDNESWITKKKPESQRRDYSKHWLHQEAEQRRLEQQDRVNRQQQARAPAPKTLPPQSVSPQQPPHPQTTSYLPTYPPQNASPTYSSYPQALKNPSPIQSNNNNNNNNMWRNQATTYQPHMPTQAPNGDKALPDSIIHNITQRVNNKNSKNTYSNTNGRLGNTYGNNNYRDENYHDYMNADALSAPSTHTPLYQSGMGPSQQPPFNSQSQDHSSGQDQRLLSVSGKKKCSHCSEELGRGAAMIIESLRLFYHIPCFKCCVCGIQLGNGSAGADVRVRNHKLHCHNCYSNDEGMKFSKV